MNMTHATKTAMLACVAGLTALANANPITGNPAADGWAHAGHSLENNIYSRGAANHGFDIYTTSFTVTDSSMFVLPGHEGAAYDNYYGIPSGGRQWDTSAARLWDVGHTVIGLGGVFSDMAAPDAGWTEFTGPTVNAGLPAGSGQLRLQAKFGTADATWSTSTIAPGSGNGAASTNDGGLGTVFIRSSGWLFLGDNAWENYAGEMMGLQETGHITRVGTTVGVDAGRLIWEYDAQSQRPISWQLLVNTTLLDLDAAPGFTGLTPSIGDMIIASVQTSPFTDAVVQLVPAPGSAAMLGFLGLAACRRRR